MKAVTENRARSGVSGCRVPRGLERTRFLTLVSRTGRDLENLS
jgi:hypothetical protein